MDTRPVPPPPLRNAPQLITYVDRLAGDLVGLGEVMRGPFGGAFGGTHLLPFFPPIDLFIEIVRHSVTLFLAHLARSLVGELAFN